MSRAISFSGNQLSQVEQGQEVDQAYINSWRLYRENPNREVYIVGQPSNGAKILKIWLAIIETGQTEHFSVRARVTGIIAVDLSNEFEENDRNRTKYKHTPLDDEHLTLSVTAPIDRGANVSIVLVGHELNPYRDKVPCDCILI